MNISKPEYNIPLKNNRGYCPIREAIQNMPLGTSILIEDKESKDLMRRVINACNCARRQANKAVSIRKISHTSIRVWRTK